MIVTSVHPRYYQSRLSVLFIHALAFVLAAFILSACGEQSTDEGSGNALNGDSEGESTGSTVAVRYQDRDYPVDLAALDTVEVKGEAVVRLTEVFEASGVETALDRLVFDFMSEDETFRSSDKSNCDQTIPLDGEKLAGGYIDPVTHNLVWDDDLGFSGCMYVNGCGYLLASDAGGADSGGGPDGDESPAGGPDGDTDAEPEIIPNAKSVSVTYRNQDYPVDLSLLGAALVEIEGESYVRLSDVFDASGVETAVEQLVFDFMSADEAFRSSDKEFCAQSVPLEGSLLAKGYIQPVSRTLEWDDDLDFAGCMFVGDCGYLLASDAPAR